MLPARERLAQAQLLQLIVGEILGQLGFGYLDLDVWIFGQFGFGYLDLDVWIFGPTGCVKDIWM